MSSSALELVLGPLLFNWPAERVRSFYARMADTPIRRVYLGEVVCGKREPLLAAALAESAERLQQAGKEVVWSTLALPGTPRERRLMRELVSGAGLVELNDLSGLMHLDSGAPFVAGPLLNVYNEATAQELASRGCVRLCANVELPLASISAIARACPGLDIEVFAYGRLPLALSARCYHARAHGLHKDNCQFVCDRDPDGLTVRTVEGAAFLAVNGIQTLSHGVQLVDAEAAELREAGVTALRLSPHSGNMPAVVAAFHRFAEGGGSPHELQAAVASAEPPGPLVSGYLHGAAGMRPITPA